MAPLNRDQKFQLRLTDEERQMLEAIADRDGLSAADVVRQLVRREYAATLGREQPKKPKRTK
jgi:DNA-binding GntR family transcriptional regulator